MTLYKKYIKYVDSLEGIARMPYMTNLENPPDLCYQYLRKLTKKEFYANKQFQIEFKFK